ncbi:PREDICTED: uncharacterized protein LOC105451434 [Wasmannia auropunctata]|uniref:uncharacterized protein LOC105451434 n=1 Tax=Wasmannia auropunctata TaxID=64793 RepID=UPI0005EFD5D4|nr:PREDICTED: uncharacterized protein LOC105451434 [Wasmannia auropunctata]
MFVCLTQLLVVSLCFHLVRIFLIVSSEKATKEALMPIIFVTVEILYLFLSNSIGQTMTDHNSYVFATVYRVEWYLTPLHIQKMILFLLLKGAKSYALNMYGGLFVPSFETFATLVKASVSYFTVVLSTQ